MAAIILALFLLGAVSGALHPSLVYGALTGQSTFQESYTYQSDNASFKDSPAYLLCSAVQARDISVCPEPTAKTPAPPKPMAVVKKAVPIKIEIPEKKVEIKAEKEIVFFNFDSYRIRPKEKMKLNKIKSDKGGGDYRITGYTCDIGTKKYNDRLALKRARAVRGYLGVKAEVAGKGKCCYLDRKVRSKNRRVEIEFKGRNVVVERSNVIPGKGNIISEKSNITIEPIEPIEPTSNLWN